MENYILEYPVGENAFNAEHRRILFSKSALAKEEILTSIDLETPKGQQCQIRS